MVVATGGFRDAALCLLEGAESAELQAISRVAEHRLARGIWTSPGAGDLRRALRRSPAPRHPGEFMAHPAAAAGIIAV